MYVHILMIGSVGAVEHLNRRLNISSDLRSNVDHIRPHHLMLTSKLPHRSAVRPTVNDQDQAHTSPSLHPNPNLNHPTRTLTRCLPPHPNPTSPPPLKVNPVKPRHHLGKVPSVSTLVEDKVGVDLN
jgi:hypothetical protein